MSRSLSFAPFPLGVTQSITTSGTTDATSAGVGSQTRFVAISATEAAFYAFGASDVEASATAGTFIQGGDTHFVQIRPGQYVAAIQASTGGTVYVSEFAS